MKKVMRPMETRTEKMQALCTPTERKIIEEAAQARGWTVSDYLRAAGLTCSAVDGQPGALKLVAHNFVQAVKEWFTDLNTQEWNREWELEHQKKGEVETKSPNR